MLNRRTFLTQSMISLIGSSALRAYSRPTGDELPRFNMLVVGDSVIWGQGLEEKEKFYSLIHARLQEVLKARTFPAPLVLAHSDAPIFPRLQRDKDFVTPNSLGETRLPNPSILFQASAALTHYKKPGEAGPENVHLILANGGINDFRAERFALPILREKSIEKYAKEYCFHGMGLLLRFLATGFPNARIIVPGYYAIISEHTDPDFLRRPLLKHILGINSKVLFNIPFVPESRAIRDELAERAAAWVTHSTKYLNAAVDSVNAEFPVSGGAGQRVTFVPAPFCSRNAYGAGLKGGSENEQSFVWELNDHLLPDDPMIGRRAESCREDGLEGILYFICKRAAAFHPNRAGARAYATAIQKELEKIIPSTNWMNDPKN